MTTFQKFSDARDRVLKHLENGPASLARLMLVAAPVGSGIGVLDATDIIGDLRREGAITDHVNSDTHTVSGLLTLTRAPAGTSK